MAKSGSAAAKRGDGDKINFSIPYPFAPKIIKTNDNTSVLKFVAMITMLIDHAGAVLFPQWRVMRVIGRIAFPIYAYCLTVGCIRTRDVGRYLARIVLLALISQPIYAVAMHHTTPAMYSISFSAQPVQAAVNFYLQSWYHPSILVSLALGLVVIWTVRERRLILTLGLLLMCWKMQNYLDYGVRGIQLMLLFSLFVDKPLLSFPLVTLYMVWWGTQSAGYSLFGVNFGTQMFAVMALPLIYIPMKGQLHLNKWAFYLFYPVHLILILLLDAFVL